MKTESLRERLFGGDCFGQKFQHFGMIVDIPRDVIMPFSFSNEEVAAVLHSISCLCIKAPLPAITMHQWK